LNLVLRTSAQAIYAHVQFFQTAVMKLLSSVT
jgi:hypothetical protein